MRLSNRVNSKKILAIVVLLTSSSVMATSKTYIGVNNGNFAVPGSWMPNGIPVEGSPGDDVLMGNVKPASVTADLDVTVNTDLDPTANGFHSLTLDSSAINTGAMVLNETAGGSMGATTENIGTATSENTFNQSGGSSNFASTLNMGVNAASDTNDYNISSSGTALAVLSQFNVGVNGAGAVTQKLGSVNVDNGGFNATLSLGLNAGSSGTYNLMSGTLNADSLQVGSGGSGVFNQTGGTLTTGYFDVSTTSGTATYNFSGGTLSSSFGLTIGTNGTFNLNAGGSLTVVADVSSGGIFKMAGGTIAANTGGMEVEGGIFQLQGSNVTLNHFYGGSGTVQNGASLSCVLTVNEPVVQSSPTLVVAGFFGTIQDGSSGTLGLTLSGGGFGIKGPNTYSGPTSIQGGIFVLQASNTASPNSSVTLSGGTLEAGTFSNAIPSLAGATGVVDIPGGNLTVGSGSTPTTYGGTLTGNGTLSKAGSSTFTLSGGGSFNGTISIQSGTLAVNTTNGIPTAASVGFTGIGGTFSVNANQSLGSYSSGDLNVTNFSNNSTLTVGTNNVSAINGCNFTGTGTLAMSGTGTYYLGYGSNDNISNSDSSVSIAINSGSLYLAKAAGTTSVDGPLAVNGGTAALLASNQIADTSTVTMAGGTFNLNGFSDTIGTLTGSSGNVIFNGGTLTVASAGTTSYSGSLTGSGNLIKSLAGAFSLISTSTYSGTLSANGGSLILYNTVSASAITANSSGIVEFNQSSLNVPGIQLLSNTGGNIEYLGATVSNAYLRGTGAHTILPGVTSTFNGVTTFNSTTISQTGPAVFNNFNNGGTFNNNAALGTV